MNQKPRLSGGAWIRIILVIVLCLMVLSAFSIGTAGISFLTSCSPRVPWGLSFVPNNSWLSSHNWQVGSGSTSADSLRGINVDWLRGDVKITSSNGDKIEIIDHSTSSSRSDLIHWALEGDILHVVSHEPRSYTGCSPNWGIPWAHHSCEIRIPQKLAQGLSVMDLSLASGGISLKGLKSTSLSADVMSGDFSAEGVEAGNAVLSVASGNLNTTGFKVQTLSLDLMSGKVNLSGTFDSITTSTASGTLSLSSSSAPSRISTDLMSGNVTLSFPEPRDGFTASVDRMSGQFNCSFSTVNGAGGSYVNGNGKARYDFSMASGTINLKPA